MTKTKRLLWINSCYLETIAYREELVSAGYELDGVDCGFLGLEKLDETYDAVFLNPYFLTWCKQDNPPSGVDIGNSLDLGLWFYDQVRSGKNKLTHLYLTPIIMNRDSEIRKRIEDHIKGDNAPHQLINLSDELPSDLIRIVQATLKN